jgi:UDP:flavonoid glycosyltransferase YjiC (YdhE family)
MLRSLEEPICYGFPDIIGHLPRVLRDPYMRLADSQVIDRPLAPKVNAFRAELGLPPISRLFKSWIHSPELVIGLFPEWYAPPPPDWPPQVRLPGFPLYDAGKAREAPAGLEEYLGSGEPPIVFTAGTAMAQGAEFFRVSAEVCRAGGWRGILLTQFPEQLPKPLPDGVTHFGYAPFSAVLPRAGALVHHGGIGTTAQALAAGIPQLVAPFAHDQPDNAVRVRRLRVGDFVQPKAYRLGRVRGKLAALLGSTEVRENCRRRAADVAGSRALETACELIEELRGARQ